MLWTNSSTVLTWLNSESCHYKVFVGNRVSKIQELTEDCSWRYVDSASNPADDLTRGKPLNVLTKMNRWSQGPPFLLQDPANWPVMPGRDQTDNPTGLRKSVFCGTTAVPHQSNIPDTLDCQLGKNSWMPLPRKFRRTLPLLPFLMRMIIVERRSLFLSGFNRSHSPMTMNV